MKAMIIPICFAIGTALCWGMYGPTIGNAQTRLKPIDGGWTPFKPYVFIGIAYLVWAIIGGIVAMKLMGDNYDYSGKQMAPMQWGFLAGSLGAFGALCLTTAMMTSKGNALLVMPIVFGGAVSVTALFEVVKRKGVGVSPLLFVGIATVIVGIVLVVRNTPHGHGPKKPADGGGEAHAAIAPAEEISSEETNAS